MATADLQSGSIWRGTIAALRRDSATMFALAAPFTLLVAMLVALYGPPPPRSPADFTLTDVVWLLLLPGLIGAIGQLAVARLAGRPDEPPRRALGTALAVFPAYVAALLISSLAAGLGIFALVIPGLYLTARFLPLPAVAAIEGGGAGAQLRRCWQLTAGHGGALIWLFILGVFFLIGAATLVSIVAIALETTATVIGLKAVASFLAALVNALFGTAVAIGYATAMVVIYQRLAPAPVYDKAP